MDSNKNTSNSEVRTALNKSSGGEKIEVDSGVLEKLLSKIEKQDEIIADLTAAADLGRLNRVQSLRNKGKLVKNAKISVFNGKYVLGWRSVRDDVFIDAQGRLHEDQTVQLFLDAGVGEEPVKSDIISYREFSRLATKEEGEVIKESRDADGQVFFTIKLDNGREIEISTAFIN